MDGSGIPHDDMSTAAFMAWYDRQPGKTRYELLARRVHESQRLNVGHARIMSQITFSFTHQIRERKLGCEAYLKGMAVRIDDENVFIADVLIRSGARLPGETTLILDPVIVVEVVSPSSQHVDALTKLTHYFDNPHILH